MHCARIQTTRKSASRVIEIALPLACFRDLFLVFCQGVRLGESMAAERFCNLFNLQTHEKSHYRTDLIFRRVSLNAIAVCFRGSEAGFGSQLIPTKSTEISTAGVDPLFSSQ